MAGIPVASWAVTLGIYVFLVLEVFFLADFFFFCVGIPNLEALAPENGGQPDRYPRT